MADNRTQRPKGKKSARVGSGGNNKRRLSGKGPTPKAEDRTYHPAYKRKKEAEARAARVNAAPKLRAKLRLAEGHELISGRNPVIEAVRAGIPISRVFLVAAAAGDRRLSEVVAAASSLGAELVEVSRTELDRMTDGAAHQGVAVEVPPYEYRDLDEMVDEAAFRSDRRPGLFVALDSVTDPHNVGAALRSASAFGADGLIIPERRAAGVTAAAWKVSAGAAARVPVARVTNLVASLEHLKSQGYFVVGLDGGGDTTIDRLETADAPLVIVTGSEGKGLSRLTRDTCDQIAAIPINSEMESLNAAVATGIALYQVDRLRAAREGKE